MSAPAVRAGTARAVPAAEPEFHRDCASGSVARGKRCREPGMAPKPSSATAGPPARRAPPVPAALAILIGLVSCGGRPSLGEDASQRLLSHADPSTWEDLDPAHPGRHLRDPRTGIAFIRIDPGEFVMGSGRPAERPRRTVRLSRPYWISKTEVTKGQWRRWVEEFAGDPGIPVPDGPDEMPMQASFLDAQLFCETFGYRLPTEAEWERAALGGMDGEDAHWKDAAWIEAHSWVHTNAKGPRPVATREPNGFGLYDTVGNLAEWCSDRFAFDYSGRPDPDIDPVGPAKGEMRTLRGGSWYTLPRPQPTTRTIGAPDERNSFYGFRVAR